MKYPKTWIIVSNSEIARLFDFTGPRQPLVPLEDHVWYAPEISTFDDKQGMGHSRVGPSQHRMASHTGPDKKSDAFATTIAENLATAMKSGAFERLVLVATPKMLGLLRDRLTSPIKERIWVEIDKDLTNLSLEKVDATVKAHLVA